MSDTLKHIKDVALHTAFAAVMMLPCFLPSTPTLAVWPWAACAGGLWFVRELAQKKDGRFNPPSQWGAWKWAEAWVPLATTLLIATGITLWRVL